MISKAVITISFVVIYSCGTTNQTQTKGTNLLSDTVLTDGDGNNYSLKRLRDGNLWMTSNLKLNIPASYCYINKEDSCNLYGRLYTWESAAQACSLLGEGWQLPTKDEWQQLAHLYGPVAKDSAETRKRSYYPLLYKGSSEFNAVLGGGRNPDGSYARLAAHGFYWTATELNDSAAWFANFAKGSQALYLQDNGEKTRAFSVRCVKKNSSSK